MPAPKKEKPHRETKADHLLGLINKIYRVEREIKVLSAAEKFQQRCKKSRLILDEIKKGEYAFY